MSAARRSSGARSLAAVAGLLLGAGGCATSVPPRGEPLFVAVYVAPVAVEPILIAGADLARPWFGTLMAEQATAAARRLALERHLTETLETAGPAPDLPVLTARLSIPTALPPGYRGSRAAFKEGELAVARVELTDGRGGLLASAEATVGWDEVRWTTGGPKLRRARRPDSALLDAGELAIERAVRRVAARAATARRP